MDIDNYQKQAAETALYPHRKEFEGLLYTVMGLVGECGEIAGKVSKIMRGDTKTRIPDCVSFGSGDPEEEQVLWEMHQRDHAYALIANEAGDVAWFLVMLIDELGYAPSQVLLENLKKLEDRKRRSVIHGSGDDR